jgi:receptor protein-tyrosine kinase
VICATAITVALAIGYTALQDKVYTAESKVLIQAQPGENLFDSTASAADDSNRVSTAITLLEGEAVAAEVQKSLGLDDRPPTVSGAAADDTAVVTVTVQSDDAETAARVANAYAAGLIAIRKQQAIAGLDAASAELEAQIANLDGRIASLDAQLLDARAATTAAVAEKQAQVDSIEAQITELQRQQIQLNVAPSLTTEQQVQQQTLALQVGTLQDQVDGLRDDIDELKLAGYDLLEQSRQRLDDQRAEFTQRNDELTVDTALASGAAQIVEPATVPSEPDQPKPVTNVIIGLIAGLIIGMAAAFLREYFDDSITSPADLTEVDDELAVLAVVPAVHTKRGRSFGIAHPGSLAIEAFRNLRTNVQFLGVDRDMRVLEVASAGPSEGKTTVGSNLAVVLSQAGHRVVLVDADLRAPRVHRMFAIDRTIGLSNNLAGDSIDLTLQPISDHFSVLASGPLPPNPSELLGGKRMKAVIDELRARFDYVVVDTSPVLAVSDALAISQYVDGVIVVARSGHTSLGPLNQALAAMAQVSAPVIGVVLNRVNPRDAMADGYTYGSEYGKTSGPPTTPAPPLPAPSTTVGS